MKLFEILLIILVLSSLFFGILNKYYDFIGNSSNETSNFNKDWNTMNGIFIEENKLFSSGSLIQSYNINSNYSSFSFKLINFNATALSLISHYNTDSDFSQCIYKNGSVKFQVYRFDTLVFEKVIKNENVVLIENATFGLMIKNNTVTCFENNFPVLKLDTNELPPSNLVGIKAWNDNNTFIKFSNFNVFE